MRSQFTWWRSVTGHQARSQSSGVMGRWHGPRCGGWVGCAQVRWVGGMCVANIRFQMGLIPRQPPLSSHTHLLPLTPHASPWRHLRSWHLVWITNRKKLNKTVITGILEMTNNKQKWWYSWSEGENNTGDSQLRRRGKSALVGPTVVVTEKWQMTSDG